MTIRTELEHANLIIVDKNHRADERIQELNGEHHVLLVIDLENAKDEEQRRSYSRALAKADIISEEQVDAVLADEPMLIIVPFLSMMMAERTYRSIGHASHFVRIWVDGEPYTDLC